MRDTFDPLDYLSYLQKRWRFAAVCVSAALIAAGAGCLLMANQYTATATLLIEAPAASDPRAGSAVSPTYLESLKAYEELASNDSLFLTACQKFGLLDGANPPALEALKRRVLRVEKLKDTKVLQIRVTLPDPRKAQAVAQYLAEETAERNRSVALLNDKRALEDVHAQVEAARAKMEAARKEQARVMSTVQPELSQEIRALTEVLQGIEEKSAEASAQAAEMTAREKALRSASPSQEAASEVDYVQEHLAGATARRQELAASETVLKKQLTEKAAEMNALDVRVDAANQQLSDAVTTYRQVEGREADLRGSAGLRTEQLRVVDPGIVPQRPSFPNVPLVLVAALLLSLTVSLGWLSIQYGLTRGQGRAVRGELRVARSADR